MRRALVLLACACHGPSPVLDDFEDLSAWQASASDGVTAAIASVPGTRGRAMQLRFDLANTAGYAVARRPISLDLSGELELAFDLRGDVPINNLELKLTDASGENVWWYHRANYEFPTSWRHVTVKRRQIEFAWGPIADHTLRRIAAIELVVSTGRGGGKGAVEIDELTLRRLPAVTTPPPAPIAKAASGDAGLAVDGKRETAWRGRGPLTIDLGRERDFAGLRLWWGAAFPASYTVELSRDGARYVQAAAITGGDGGLDPLALPEASARYIRISAADVELAEVELVEPEAATLEAFAMALAQQLPRGALLRGMSGEQPYWTPVGVDGGGGHASLLSEDGALELASGATVEPFVEVGGRTITWADAPEITQTLADDYLPIPSVTWRAPGWELTVTAVATGDAAAPQLAARYALHNRGTAPLAVRLVLAVRPYQVNPPLQFLNIAGGVRKIGALAYDRDVLAVDGQPAMTTQPAPDVVGLWPSHAIGYPTRPLTESRAPVTDATGLASGALGYAITLGPDETRAIDLAAPLVGQAFPTAPFDTLLAEARAAWHGKLDRVGFRVPAAGQPIIHTLRSSLAYMLISRDGPILRPGTRSYARAWIRDGAMIGEALLRLGHPDVASAFLAWYAPYQFASGKVPCCVEAHGAVPVPENDSHGELIHLAFELWRYTRDRAQLAARWPRVLAAARYLEQLRTSERTPGPTYGLLPPTISHEGYSAKPAYSYWDDFWGLVGFRDAAAIAAELAAPEAAALATQRDAFQRDLLASITASAAQHRIDYIPGAAELGDLDATSTTIALSPGNAQAILPPQLLTRTFERGWDALVARDQPTWDAYTPYELRLIGSFARLGWRDRAWDGLARYLRDQRPRAWNQWAEVVGRELRKPRFVGDMPHAWVHSDYARSVLDLFLHERPDGGWQLAAGLPAAWFAGRGFAIERAPTPFGALSYAVTATERAITLQIDAGAPARLHFAWPLATPPGATTINGRPARWTDRELAISERPATIVIAKEP
jgi:hypothetical protein